MTSHILRLLLFCVLFAARMALAGEQLNIGVLAIRDPAETTRKWQPLVDYLEQALPGHRFTLRAYPYDELETVIERRQVDFVITQPSHYITISAYNALSSPLATLIDRDGKQSMPVYGGAIVVRADRADISKLVDFKGKTVAIAGSQAFSSYQMQAYELFKAGLAIPEDIKITEVGFPIDRPIEALLTGKADAAFVRMGLIEQMAEEGKLDPALVRVINAQRLAGSRYEFSTTLYPMWPFVAMPQVPEDLAARVAAVLLMLPHDGEVARAAKIWGFTVPANYQPVKEVMQALRSPPYDEAPEISWHDVWQRYTVAIIVAMVAGALILLLLMWLAFNRRKLAFQHELLEIQTKNLQEQQAKLTRWGHVFENAEWGIVVGSADGLRLELANPAFARQHGYSAEEVEALPVAEFFAPEERDKLPGHRQRALEMGHYTYESRHIRKDGSTFPVLMDVTVVRDDHGEVRYRVVNVQDITERKHAEMELAQYRESLEAQVEERTAALSIAKDAAEAASRAKSTFLSNMSHELRTPMNAIMGMTAIARRKATDPKLIDQLSKIDQASHHLLNVINDILDLSKIEAGRMTLEESSFKLGELMENIKSLTNHKADERGLKLITDISPGIVNRTIQGDALRLRQILINLTGNAVKFTHSGSVTIRAQLVEENPTEVLLRFEVQDTGIGISDESQARLFTAFEQADTSTTRKYGGTGLGLAISKRLVELMGGSIGIKSQLGDGSLFWFTVRLGSIPDHDELATVSVTMPAEEQLKRLYTGSHILLVEDEPVNREVSLGLLEEVGLVVDLAEDGAIAIALAQQTTYDLILMDMQMPRVNGVDATRTIRSLPGWERIPILAMTANAFNEDRQACLDAGMNDHISKPVEPGVLFEALLKWLSQNRSHQH